VFLAEYFHKQVVKSLQGRREIVQSPLGQWSLLWTLFIHDLLPSAALAAGCVFWARRQASGGATGILPVQKAGGPQHWRDASGTHQDLSDARRGPLWFCLLTAASASIPIVISPKQSAYYAAPSWPFYTMGLALWCLPAVQALLSRASTRGGWERTTWRVRSIALAAMGLTVLFSPLWAGTYHRDRQVMLDVERIARVVEPHATLVVPLAMEHEWSLEAYLYRGHFISLKVTDAVAPGAYHLDFANSPRALPSDFELAGEQLALYRLYKPSRIAALGGDASTSR
jgi:hypothetical protein